jgi:hypothetical protein
MICKLLGEHTQLAQTCGGLLLVQEKQIAAAAAYALMSLGHWADGGVCLATNSPLA